MLVKLVEAWVEQIMTGDLSPEGKAAALGRVMDAVDVLYETQVTDLGGRLISFDCWSDARTILTDAEAELAK